MAKGRIVLLEDDEWVANLLSSGLREHGYEVSVVGEALAGFQEICDREPDCVVCDVTLPDFDGYSVAHRVRAASSKVSTTPFLFLAHEGEEPSRLGEFHVGAAVHMTKPFRLEEISARVDELVEMGRGLNATRASFLDRSSVPPEAEALRGNIDQMSIVTVLTLLEMERRTGELKIASGSSEARVMLSDGFALGGTREGKNEDLVAILREILKWKTGTFSFRVGAAPAAPLSRRTISGVLVEAVHLNANPPSAAPPGHKAPTTAKKQ
jgi:two-component system, OmpR family, response regulator